MSQLYRLCWFFCLLCAVVYVSLSIKWTIYFYIFHDFILFILFFLFFLRMSRQIFLLLYSHCENKTKHFWCIQFCICCCSLLQLQIYCQGRIKVSYFSSSIVDGFRSRMVSDIVSDRDLNNIVTNSMLWNFV